MAERDIVKELRRVDDSFAMLKAGRELDDRLADMLDGRAPPRRRKHLPVIVAGAAVVAAAAVAVVLALPGGAPQVAKAPEVVAPPAPPAPPVLVEQAPVPEKIAAQLPPVRGERIAVNVAEDVRFVDVPLGKLEVRAPSVVDVDKDGAVVVSGTVRVLEKGKAPRTLIEGQSIGWRVSEPKGAEKPALEKAPTSMNDADVQKTLERARALQGRGSYAEAADVLADLLAKKPGPRVTDTVSFERASLLAKARDVADACSALVEHAKRFPKSENAAAVAAARARLSCK